MTLRGVDWAVVLGGSLLGAAILALCVAIPTDGTPLTFVRLALVGLVAAAAFVLDEPAADAVDAVPVTRRRRTAVRTTAALLPLAVWAVGLLALERRHEATPAVALLVEGAGLLVVTVALAAVLRLAGRSAPGEVVASLVGAVVLGGSIFPMPGWAPLFPAGDPWNGSTTLWSGAAGIGAALVVALSRDPAQRRGKFV